MTYVVLTYGLTERERERSPHIFAGNVLLLPSCRATPLSLQWPSPGMDAGSSRVRKNGTAFSGFFKANMVLKLLSSHFLSSPFHSFDSLGAKPAATVQRSSIAIQVAHTAVQLLSTITGWYLNVGDILGISLLSCSSAELHHL